MTNTTVYVQYSSSPGFTWGKNPSNMVPLTTSIDTESSSPITYEFIRIGTESIWYKLPPNAAEGTELPTSNGPTQVVDPDAEAGIAFSNAKEGTYYTGYVKVTDDGPD
jgi:hypothetical protein